MNTYVVLVTNEVHKAVEKYASTFLIIILFCLTMGVWKSRKPESGIGTGIGTETGSGTGIGTGMG